ncbi:hypothetical protein K435DRAFT_867941 [Dendrothele bispora CBS 962.96]|uniref:Uncharacterized protein n=1 Tax=Dendrothele bispora (strain CBS 962.96) TaxID=1314807 RepID=A0A4V4HDD2_DENBC|nr:hypothetical protein K435DRAFT_867941 [Dendrothele bispora CBS 962.96]
MSDDSLPSPGDLAQATQRKTRRSTQMSEASVSTRPQRVAAAQANMRLPNATRSNKRAGSPSVQPETAKQKQKRTTTAGSNRASTASSGTDSTQGLGTAKARVKGSSQKDSQDTPAGRGGTKGKGRGRGVRGSQGSKKNKQSSACDKTHDEMNEPVNAHT